MQGERDERETLTVAEGAEPGLADGTVAEPLAGAAAPPVEDELARSRAQAAEYEDRWKRSTAEFINYKRRTEQERADLLRGANGALILELLPVLDDLERALANLPTGEAASKWVEGVQLVERKFRAILERQGVRPIEALGQPFDPAFHEAVGGSGQTVAQEYQRGYTQHGRVLRPAMVVVGDDELPVVSPQSSEVASDDPAATRATTGDFQA